MTEPLIQGGEKQRDGMVSGLLDGWDAAAARKPQKRSIAIAGHRTSISLEKPFWDGLRTIALDKGVSIAALVAAIDAVRGEAGLSSAIRSYVYSRHSGEQARDAGGRTPGTDRKRRS